MEDLVGGVRAHVHAPLIIRRAAELQIHLQIAHMVFSGQPMHGLALVALIPYFSHPRTYIFGKEGIPRDLILSCIKLRCCIAAELP